MRFAFVIRLGQDSRPEEGTFEGWAEDVDSCTEIRFRSTAELLRFLGQRFEIAKASADGVAKGKACPATIEKKARRRNRRLP